MATRLSITPSDYNLCTIPNNSPSPICIKYKKTELFDYNGRPIPEVFTWCRCHIRYHNSKIQFDKWKCTCTVRRLYLNAKLEK